MINNPGPQGNSTDASSFTGTTLATTIVNSSLNTVNALSIADATTPSLTCATGKTNTGFVLVQGKTSGGLKLTCADAAGQTVTVNEAAQTVGAATLTIPNCGGVSRNLVTSATGRATAQAAANANILTVAVPAADASYIVSANVLITTATTHNFTVTCAYTDEGSTSRTLTFTFSNVGGTLASAIINTGGAVPYEGIPLHIRCKASTNIVFATAAGGTYTTVAYIVEANVTQLQ